MKRTRRIEVVRFTRRINVGQDDAADAERPSGDSMIEALENIAPMLEQPLFVGSAAIDVAADHQPERGLPKRLTELLKLRKRM